MLHCIQLSKCIESPLYVWKFVLFATLKLLINNAKQNYVVLFGVKIMTFKQTFFFVLKLNLKYQKVLTDFSFVKTKFHCNTFACRKAM